jgi:hypothetical protein
MSQMHKDPWPEAPCCMFSRVDENCRCGDDERVLRAILAGAVTTPMTHGQRAWCYGEFLRVEGNTLRMVEGLSDLALARAVLCAWLDEARDKGWA